MTAEDKLDRVEQRLTDLVVTLSNVAGDVRAVLARLDDQSKDLGDHETRMRLVESRVLNNDVDHRIAAVESQLQDALSLARTVHAGYDSAIAELQKFRWISTGAAVLLGILAGGIGSHLTTIFH